MRRRRARESGQALVLGALLLVVVAGTLLATLNLGNAVHERIRLQNAADAQAHGLAVLEARAFNLFAASNRALASAHVSLAAIHAYHSATSFSAALYDGTFWAMQEVVALEVAEACLCQPGCCNAVAAGLAAETEGVAAAYALATKDRPAKIRALERPFRSSVDALEGMIDGQIALQRAMQGFVADAVAQGGGDALGPLAETNASEARFDDPGAGSLSARSFRRAFERSQLKKAAILREIANGSRWGGGGATFDADCNFIVNRGDLSLTGGLSRLGCEAANIALFTPTMRDINRSIHMCKPTGRIGALYGGSMTTLFAPGSKGTALLADKGTSPWELPLAQEGHIRRAGRDTAILAGDGDAGWITFQCFTKIAPFPLQMDALVATEPGGIGRHEGPGTEQGVHSGTHRWKGLTTKFMEFAPVSRPATAQGSLAPGEGIDGQPVTYVVARQDLRLVERDDGSFAREKAWETNEAGELRIGSARLGLVPAGEGFAIGKAMAYYHRPGAWKEGPNFWFPYWRAKLHPLDEREAEQLARPAGRHAGKAAAAVARAIGGPRWRPSDPRAAR